MPLQSGTFAAVAQPIARAVGGRVGGGSGFDGHQATVPERVLPPLLVLLLLVLIAVGARQCFAFCTAAALLQTALVGDRVEAVHGLAIPHRVSPGKGIRVGVGVGAVVPAVIFVHSMQSMGAGGARDLCTGLSGS